DCFKDNGYLLDTHSAVGYGVYKKYQEDSHDDTKNILLSTASPYKFPGSVYKAIAGEDKDEYEAVEAIHDITKVDVPKPLQGLKDKEILHQKVIDKEAIIDYIGEAIKEL
ncbi:MAG: threonine synthase, partial [Erysipelotrichaceae bacterium]|nr:threonine synthase [Erysipelotrichaceae bacterium]